VELPAYAAVVQCCCGAAAAERPAPSAQRPAPSAGQQSIDISRLPGAQQQTRHTLMQRSIDGTDR